MEGRHLLPPRVGDEEDEGGEREPDQSHPHGVEGRPEGQGQDGRQSQSRSGTQRWWR